MQWWAEIYTTGGKLLAEATGKGFANAVMNAKRKAKIERGYNIIGKAERFPGGSTYHVQFGKERPDGAISLTEKYVVLAWEVSD